MVLKNHLVPNLFAYSYSLKNSDFQYSHKCCKSDSDMKNKKIGSINGSH
jgi:hypothetical protein